MHRLLVLMLALFFLPAQAFAARLVENEGKICLKPGFLTQIWFSQPLIVRNVLAGDSTKLMLEIVDNVIYIKPTQSVINTDLVVITNNERYHLYLVTSDQNYDPDVVLPAAAPVAKDENRIDLDPRTYAVVCDYTYTGDPRLKPAGVYRIRGFGVKKTLIELNPNFPEIPSIAAKILGKDVAVNARYKNQFLVIDNDIFDSLTVIWENVKGEIKIRR
ncbi:TrbG/VirB9 family P-type conjugative transfer protein [Sporolituus thermophilus]|uniref:Conjugal transfer protein n=1 Tax=Sporolituus thermophilus DSM 23256 TaxID=1123285 RepID=A0A1G7MJN4_9FIRM|nr:TrbG/VirB9 family P-type conjugative transfer protein [Sporolituus thermophilus]SDF61330.1 Conjugal transfer protein [Sporolituus thermophilus DSM 23256]